MKKNTNIVTFSQVLLLLVISLQAVNLIFNDVLTKVFSLQPQLVITHFEVWRLITFPFVTHSIEGFILFVFTFLIVSPKLEEIIQKRIYPLILFLMICLQGTVFTLIFWKNGFTFNGMEGLSFFVLVLYTTLQFSDKLYLLNLVPVRISLFTLLLSLSWLSSITAHAFMSGGKLEIIPNLSSFLFGVTCGLIVFIQIRLIKNIRQVKSKDLPPIQIPKPEELSVAMKHQNEMKKYYQAGRQDNYYHETELEFSEERLNELLDKIKEYGLKTLSPDELQYLRDYSNRL